MQIRTSRTNSLPQRSRQQGAILVVALVILLLMTMVGLTSSVNTVLQQKMSIAYQQRGMSSLAAEAALRTAEAYLTANITRTQNLSNFSGGTLGLYANYTVLGVFLDVAPVSDSFNDVVDPSLWTAANSIEVVGYDPSVALPPRYIIEYIGRDKGTANKLLIDYNNSNNAASVEPHAFQITAIGWSRDEGIYSVLQSTFKTGKGAVNFVY